MFRWVGRLAVVVLFNLVGANGLLAAEWQVVKVTGVVWVVDFGIEPMRATAGMVLPADATIATTRNARAMLRHGADILNLGPATQLAPQSRPVRGLTTVLMRQGEAVLDIEHLDKPHFAVETPFLAAVVKGTRFTVDVTDDNAAVSVQRGRVRVTSFAARESVDVTNGETARTSRGKLEFSGSGAQVNASSAVARSAVVEAADGTALVGRNDDMNDETNGDNDASTNANDSSASASQADSSGDSGVTSKGSADDTAAGVHSKAKAKKHVSARTGFSHKSFSGHHVGNGHFTKNRRHRH